MSRDDKKRAAAQAALDLVERGMVIGVGTGSTTDHFIDALGAAGRVREAVASSRVSAERLRRAGVAILDLNDARLPLPLYVDGADEATARLELIKGGGGALAREKILAAASTRFVCIVDDGKLVERLGAFPLAVEVLPLARRYVARELERLGGRAAWRTGFVTDNGNAILDVQGLRFDDPLALEREINQIAGVVANGLFCQRRADLLLVGADAGVRSIG
ncbi:MAG TPA: ribose-5-phosphate isomerase RpiA [Candidatus Polarisedimenticolaceae bacterium]|nr:ribose-5-phosphate isomerase RpiA [Candidatus Polarisedimenticolaceae bacterium]